jgi:hypothetical protein
MGFFDVIEEIVVEEEILTGFGGYGRGYGGPSLGIDVTDGDLVENLGGGIGIDLETGQVEADFGGLDVPL